MAKKDRTGNRKSREQRKQFKVPELGYYLIVTDTEATERCYFTGLHQALPEDVRNKLVIKVVETKTRTMIDKCLELTAYDAQYRIPWIVFDRDQVQGFDEIVAEAVSKGIQVMGCGIQKGAGEKYRGVEIDATLLPKVKVEVVVSKIPVDTVIEAAKKCLYTGHIGDGKIFVYGVDRVVKVRTGEEDMAALQDVE